MKLREMQAEINLKLLQNTEKQRRKDATYNQDIRQDLKAQTL
jgi:hypothetical protein